MRKGFLLYGMMVALFIGVLAGCPNTPGDGDGDTNATTNAVTNTNTATLAAPANVTAVAGETGQIQVNWDAVTGAEYYIVFYSYETTTWSKDLVKAFTVKNSGDRFMNLTNLIQTNYNIWVVAATNDTMGTVSAMVTSAPGSDGPPDAPSAVTATVTKDTFASDGEIEVTWTGARNSGSYTIVWGTDPTFANNTDKKENAGSGDKITGLSQNTYYVWVVPVESDSTPGTPVAITGDTVEVKQPTTLTVQIRMAEGYTNDGGGNWAATQWDTTTYPIDATHPVHVVLHNNEDLLASTEKVVLSFTSVTNSDDENYKIGDVTFTDLSELTDLDSIYVTYFYDADDSGYTAYTLGDIIAQKKGGGAQTNEVVTPMTANSANFTDVDITRTQAWTYGHTVTLSITFTGTAPSFSGDMFQVNLHDDTNVMSPTTAIVGSTNQTSEPTGTFVFTMQNRVPEGSNYCYTVIYDKGGDMNVTGGPSSLDQIWIQDDVAPAFDDTTLSGIDPIVISGDTNIAITIDWDNPDVNVPEVLADATFRVIYKNWAAGGTVYLPGDHNSWAAEPFTDSITVPAGGEATNTYTSAVTTALIGLGDNAATLEHKVSDGDTWSSGQWTFTTWSLSGVTLASSDQQINIACDDNDVVVLTVDVDATTLTAVVDARP